MRTVIDLRQPSELTKQPNPFAHHAQVTYHHIALMGGVKPPSGAGDPLLEMYKVALLQRGEAFRAVFAAIAAAQPGAVLFHCTAGKDRTGLVAGLLLALAKVDEAAIASDYALTADHIVPLVDELVADASSRGVDVNALRTLLVAKHETMQRLLVHLSEAHGGIREYMTSIGIGPVVQVQLVRRLLD